MTAQPVSFGYVIVYVQDVAATLAFYDAAFGLGRRFFNDAGGQAYGELETGATRLAFASLSLAAAHLPEPVSAAAPDRPPLGCEIALVASDVAALYRRAIAAGAVAVSEPAAKPWGQTVAYVRDCNGFLVELCTAVE
jgi:catechol 2,3-dioxygenase-like lactoylglutathione lyase family enzyme